MITLYLLKNKCNTKVYVGQTQRTLEISWNRGHGYISSHKMHNAISKYGKKNFYYEVITFCGTQKSANSVEQIFIEKYDSINSGYNIAAGGTSQVMTGRKHSKESLEKMSESHKGNQAHLGHCHSEKTKDILRLASSGNKNALGHILSETQKANISKSKIGIRASVATEFSPKISYEIAERIREEKRSTSATHQNIADKYGVSRSLVTDIINNKRWVKND